MRAMPFPRLFDDYAVELPSLTQTLQPVFEPPPSDPLIAIPLSLDRLKSASYLIICLLK